MIYMGLPQIRSLITRKSIAIVVGVIILLTIIYLWLTPDNIIKDNFFDKWRDAGKI